MKARYKGCKKEIAKLQLACDENVSTYDQLLKDYDGALTREKGLHERVEDLEEEKQELEEVNTKQANQIKQL
ncbi:zinc finger CCCH domain-containing protein 34-like protein, partial [Tanacetum coccineum]